MDQLPTRLQGPLLLQPKVFGDERGFFCETFRASALDDLGVTEAFVQDNHSRSRHGTVRGMHFQIGAGASKLVRCGRGTIVDVLVDLRRGSPTYGEWEAYELSDVLYKQSAYYSAEVERGIAFDDPEVGVDWGLPREELVYSDRDATAPRL